MFCTRVAWVCLVCLLLCKEEGSFPLSLQSLRDMGLYVVPMYITLLGFGMGTMLANFQMCGIMLVLRAVSNMLVRNASPRGPMCFRCRMFNMSGPCKLLFFTLFYCLLDLNCSEYDVISLYFFGVALLMFVLFVACL